MAYERALAYARPLEAPPRRPEAEDRRAVEAETVPADAEPETTIADTTRWVLPDDPNQPKRSAERAWRLAADPPERAGGGRARQWRPAAPPRPVSVFDAATEQDFQARRQALATLVAPPGADANALLEALRAFLASPVLEQVERHNDAERWIASLIVGNAPRGDALVDLAIEHFHWDEGRVGPRSLVGAGVLARREDLRFLRTVDGVGSPHQGAWTALRRPPSRWRTLANRLTPDLGRRVGAFLAVVRSQRPGLAGSLNAEAVAWWDDYLSRPRLGPLAIWGLAAALLLSVVIASSDATLRAPLAGAGSASTPIAVVGAIVLLRLYGVAWPRQLWRRRWAAKAPAWVRVAWAPSALAGLALAALIPASAVATLTLAALALAPMGWAITVGEPDTRQLGQPIPTFRWRGPIITFPIAIAIYWLYWGLLRPGVRFPWQVRSLFAFTYLAVFWLIAVGRLPSGAADQMTVPLIAAAVAFVAGAGTLGAGWQGLSRRIQGGALAGLTALIAGAVVALWLARSLPGAAPIAVALVCSAVLLHKAPATQLFGAGATVRDLAMRFGGVILVCQVVNSVSLMAVLAELAFVVAMCSLGFAITAFEALRKRRTKRGGLREIGVALVRYGWIAGVPIAVVREWSGQTALLLAGGLWMLAGVGVTIAALTPPRASRPVS